MVKFERVEVDNQWLSCLNNGHEWVGEPAMGNDYQNKTDIFFKKNANNTMFSFL